MDKTGLLFELARKETDAQYFLSRTRRFGKSPMLFTLQAMFEDARSKAAMRQIRERGYADKWKGGKRPVTLVGIMPKNVRYYHLYDTQKCAVLLLR